MADNTFESTGPDARRHAISKALRLAARRMRAAGVSPTARGNVVLQHQRWQGTFKRGVWIAFWVVVALPVTLAALYFGFIASDRYVSSMQFTVRSGDRSPVDLLGGLAGLSLNLPEQDTDIVANYIGSNDMLTALNRNIDIRAVYSRPDVDLLSRFNPSAPVEKFNRYWNNHIDVKVDNPSSIVTVSIEAFTPTDALAVAKSVLRESESLVNRMSDRARRDSLRDTMTTLTQAQNKLETQTRAVRDLRNRLGILDPKVAGDALANTVAAMQKSLADLRIEYSSQLRWVGPDAPQMRILARRIADTERQTKGLERQLAGSARVTLAGASAEFDQANLDLTVAQQQYVAAVAAVEGARGQLDAQRVYVLPFAQPTMPQQAIYPRRFLMISIIAGICLLLWGACIGLAVLARNNLAV